MLAHRHPTTSLTINPFQNRFKLAALAALVALPLQACDSGTEPSDAFDDDDDDRIELAQFTASVTQLGETPVGFRGNYVFHHPQSSTISLLDSEESPNWSLEMEAEGIALSVMVDDEGDTGVQVEIQVDGRTVRSEEVDPGGALAIDYYLDE
jgi:hypothetical protein